MASDPERIDKYLRDIRSSILTIVEGQGEIDEWGLAVDPATLESMSAASRVLATACDSLPDLLVGKV